MEARAARRQDKRAREDSPEMNKLIGGGDVMGGDDSFSAAKARHAPFATAQAPVAHAPPMRRVPCSACAGPH